MPPEPDITTVYRHTTDIMAMPVDTFGAYEAILIALKQRVAALASCFEAVKGTVEEVYP